MVTITWCTHGEGGAVVVFWFEIMLGWWTWHVVE